MELTYVLIAVLILALPIVLSRLFSASRSREKNIARAMPSPAKPAAAPRRSDALRVEVASLLAQGGKMEAIKLMRDRKGLPLAEAKEAVETIAREEAIVAPAPGLIATIQRAQQMSEEVRRLASAGRKVEAIKLLREKSGLGLKEAKDLVDRLS
jgi:ribosomal protein L7/L12